jgi:hypothetical protein
VTGPVERFRCVIAAGVKANPNLGGQRRSLTGQIIEKC